MAKVDQSSEEYKTRLAGQRARTKGETEKREKAAGRSGGAKSGGIKSELKKVIKTLSSGGAADRASKADKDYQRRQKKAMPK